MSNADKWNDLIQLEDAVGWIEWNRNPVTASIVGAEMLDGMADAAVDAVRKGSKDGLIKRSDAVHCIEEAIPESAPYGMDSYRSSKWGTLRAMFREAMWYPAAIE